MMFLQLVTLWLSITNLHAMALRSAFFPDPIIKDEYFLVFDKYKNGNIWKTTEKIAEDAYSIKIRHFVDLGKHQYLIVKGNLEDVSHLAEAKGALYMEPNKMIRGYPDLSVPQNPTGSTRESNRSEITNSLKPTIEGTALNNICMVQDVHNIWGLNRIGKRSWSGDQGPKEYTYSQIDSGKDVNVYIVDSGIHLNHVEFGDRARWGFTAEDMDGDEDLNGHGTHVAGIVGGSIYGVAKYANLISVKVLDGTKRGGLDGLVTAFNWIKKDYLNSDHPKSVINLSLGFANASQTLDDAVEDMIELGIPVVVAAGNEDTDACRPSPARVARAITVGATNSSDHRASFSNWGNCVNIFAPGENIPSAYSHDFQLGYTIARISGTSQAAPHVTGVIARYMSTLKTKPSPDEIRQWLHAMATKCALTDVSQSPNRLLYINCPTGEGGWDVEENSGTCHESVEFDIDLHHIGISALLITLFATNMLSK